VELVRSMAGDGLAASGGVSGGLSDRSTHHDRTQEVSGGERKPPRGRGDLLWPALPDSETGVPALSFSGFHFFLPAVTRPLSHQGI